MKKIIFSLALVLIVMFSLVSADNVSAQSCGIIGTSECQNGGTEACVCMINGWVCTNCAYGCLNGVCKSAPTLVPTPVCTSGARRCVGNRLDECVSNSWKLVENCFYGCNSTSGICYDCSGSGYRCVGSRLDQCVSGYWKLVENCFYGCSGGTCVSPVNGVCGRFSGIAYPGFEKGIITTLCDAGTVSWVDDDGSDGTFNWKCIGTNGGSTATCQAVKDMCYYEFEGRSFCIGSATACEYGDDYPKKTGWVYKWPPDCASGGICCVRSAQAHQCDNDLECVFLYGDCYTCDEVYEDEGTFHRECVNHPNKNSGTNGVCGAANGSSACSWSSLGTLCSSGNLSIGDSGGSDGTFNWSCNGVKASTCPASVTSVSCSATRKVVNATCGTSNQTCNDGTATNFRPETRSDGIYSLWDCNATCNGSNKTGCAYKTCDREDGVCGTTAANTCKSGKATSTGSETRSDGIYALWRCDGECGGSNDTGCAYKTCSRVDGVCGTTAANTCNSGKVTNTRLETRSDGIYALWRCDGECSGTNSSSCSFRSAACGYARGGSSCLPPAAGLCAVGTASAVSTNTATNTFSWNCSGSTGAIDSCTSIRTVTNGECGSAKGGNFSSTPTVGLCNKGDPTEVTLSGTTYSWSCVSDCNGIADLCSAIYDVPPVPSVTPIPIPPTSTDPAPNPSGGQRLHNCQFNNPNLVTIKIGVTDPNGISDVAGVYLRFSGLSTEYGPVKPSAAGVVTFNIDITSMPDGVYTVQAKADDVHDNLTSGWVSLPYTFKKWDCLVNVSGTFYDGSDVPISCAADSGYSNPIPSELSFDFRYTIGTSSPRNMTVNSPNFNSDTNNRLYWTSPVDYQPLLINFPGTNPTQARVNGVCYNTSSLDAGIADPFAPNPSLSVQYSSIMDQEAWYLVGGGAIVAKGIVTNYVPATCTNNCRTTNDMILSAKTASLSPYDKAETENRVYDNKVLNLKPYSYDALKRQYLSTKGVGSTTLSDATWSQLPTKQGVIFVNGDLTIDTNIITTDLVMIVAKGAITVNPSVTRVDGILMGNNISIGGQSANQLIINGSIYSLGDVTLNRSFEPKKLNNATPAIKIEYNPSLIFKLPAKMIQAISRWRLVQ